MRIAIVGGGVTGLTAAYYLSQAGHQISVFEKSDHLGGLAGSFREKNWQWPLEFYFHHLFASDKEAYGLIKELNLSEEFFFRRPKTSIFRNGRIFQFDSPFSVLNSPLLNFPEKIRTGVVTAYLKLTDQWLALEKTPAASWLKKYYGNKPYQILWEPLLRGKFGPKAEVVSAAWFWARIKKRTASLGYFRGGFQTLIDRLKEKIEGKNGRIFLNFEIKSLSDLKDFDKTIFTTPLPLFYEIIKKSDGDLFKNLNKLEIVGALNLILILKEKFLTDDTYWLNINEPGFPFIAVVEHTNFIDPKYYAGNHLLYVGGYYPQSHRFFKMKPDQLFNEFLPFLRKINPDYNFHLSTVGYSLFIDPYAQPIIPINYSRIIPPIKTPIKNVYLATMSQVYPWDRGVNYAVDLGRKVADEIFEEAQ